MNKGFNKDIKTFIIKLSQFTKNLEGKGIGEKQPKETSLTSQDGYDSFFTSTDGRHLLFFYGGVMLFFVFIVIRFAYIFVINGTYNVRFVASF